MFRRRRLGLDRLLFGRRLWLERRGFHRRLGLRFNRW